MLECEALAQCQLFGIPATVAIVVEKNGQVGTLLKFSYKYLFESC